MKKLLGILVLGLFFIGNAHSKTIYFKKCYDYVDEDNNGKFDSKQFEKYYIKIDTSKETLNMVSVYTDAFVKDMNDRHKSDGKSTRLDKVFIWERHIVYQDNNLIKLDGGGILDLKKKKLTIGNLVRQCK